MWLSISRMTSCPGWVWLSRAQRLPMVPLGTKSEASLPTISAARRCRRWIVGSSSQTSSPTAAAAIAARIDSVGSVKVSLRSSTVRAIQPLFSQLGIDQRPRGDHLGDGEVGLALNVDLDAGLQAAGGEVGGRPELLRVADDQQAQRGAHRMPIDEQAVAAALDRRTADDALAVQRDRLGSRIAQVVERILQLEVHDRAPDLDAQPGSVDGRLPVDLAQSRELLLDLLRVGAAGRQRVPDLRLLLREGHALLEQLVVSAVEVVDQQRHARIILGRQAASHRRLRAQLDHDEEAKRDGDHADDDQPLGPGGCFSRAAAHTSPGRWYRRPAG